MSKRTMTAAKSPEERRLILDTVAFAQTDVLITKRGKPVARIVPGDQPPAVRFGALRDITTIVDTSDDLLSGWASPGSSA